MSERDHMIRPGTGVGRILLLQSRSSIEELLGRPQNERRYEAADDVENVTWLSYYIHGFDVCISNRTSLTLAISLFRGGISRHKGFQGTTPSNVAPGATRQDVIESFGKPDSFADSYKSSTGQMIPAWIGYDIGIGFEFSLRDDKVDRISIYPAQQIHMELKHG